MKMVRLHDAKVFLEKTLKIKGRISSNSALDKVIAFTLHKIGQC